MESLHVSQGSGQESHLETPRGQASGSQRPSCREEGTGLSRPPKGSQHIPHAKRKTEKPGLQFLRPLLCCPGSDSVTTRPQGGAGSTACGGHRPGQRKASSAARLEHLYFSPARRCTCHLKGKAKGLAHSRRPSNGPQVDTTVIISASAEVKKSVLSSEKYGWLLFLT